MKKCFAAVMAICLAFGLTGCGMFDSSPKDAAALMEEVRASMESNNYALNMELSMEVSTESSGFSLDIPVDIGIAGSVLGDNSHANVNVASSVFGQDIDEDFELYTTKDKTYTNSSGSWVVADIGADKTLQQSSQFAKDFFELDGFSNATMNVENSVYTVELPLSSVDTEQMLDAFAFGQLGENGVSEEQMAEALSQGVLVYVVDKVDDAYLLRSITMEPVECSFDSEENGVSYTLNTSVGFVFHFSDHGLISEQDVTVPEDVLNSAVYEEKDSTELMDDLLDSQDNSSENSGDSEKYSVPSFEDDGSDDLTSEIEPYPGIESFDSKYFASYGTKSLVPATFTTEFFVNDFSYDEADIGEYSFIPMTYKTNDTVSLYLYPDATDTEKDLLSQKICGYEFSIVPSATENPTLPDIAFGPITWGSMKASVVEAFGAPNTEYSSNGHWIVGYDLGDPYNDGSMYTLEFSGYDDSGVYSMALNYFHF